MNANAILEFLFPPQCGGCNRPGTGLCEVCAPPSAQIAARLPTLSVRALGPYEDRLRRAVLALKSGRRDVAKAGALRLRALLEPGDCIAAVPTTGVRRRERGFDGCVLMAQLLCRSGGVRIADGLQQRSGDRQRGRSRSQRLAARGRFLWCGEPLDGMEVVLLDDVVTTGSTLEDCARALRDAGAVVRRAVALAVAR